IRLEPVLVHHGHAVDAQGDDQVLRQLPRHRIDYAYLLPVLGEDDGGRGVVEEGQRAGGWCPDLGGVLAAGKDFVILQAVGRAVAQEGELVYVLLAGVLGLGQQDGGGGRVCSGYTLVGGLALAAGLGARAAVRAFLAVVGGHLTLSRGVSSHRNARALPAGGEDERKKHQQQAGEDGQRPD